MLKKNQSLVQLLLFIGILIFINILANTRFGNTALYGFIDFTEEKRFTLTDGTRNLLRNLDDVVTIEILLDGDLSPSFKRLKESVRQTLEDFRGESGYIEYRFFDPMGGTDEENIEAQKTLAQQGIYPLENRVRKADELSLKVIYPYARFYYKGRPAAVNFLKNDVPGMPEEIALENSIGLLEYQFANIIQKLQSPNRKNIVFSTGHGELNPFETRDLENSLRQFYNTDRIDLDEIVRIDPQISALIVAKPRFPFSDQDKFKIDQYVMNGGKVLWLLDALRVDLDSLRSEGDYVATDYPTELGNILFNYGVRLQP
ncbi:MAG: GldG family protein, partial [Bacteroidota bacterium]